MNSSDTFPALPRPRSVLTLTVKGPVPSFKNAKRICGKRLVTRKDVKQWMKNTILDLSSQLESAIRTKDGGISMEPLARSLIAWSKQFDDSRQWIPRISLRDLDIGINIAVIELELL